MNFEALQRRVERAERVVDRRAERTRCQWDVLKLRWHAGWTPWRIVTAGLVSGFMAGRAQPLRAADGARLMQMLSTVSAMFATVAGEAAADAAQAAESTANAAEHTASAATEAAAAAAAAAAPEPEPVAPRPAEAATELSER